MINYHLDSFGLWTQLDQLDSFGLISQLEKCPAWPCAFWGGTTTIGQKFHQTCGPTPIARGKGPNAILRFSLGQQQQQQQQQPSQVASQSQRSDGAAVRCWAVRPESPSGGSASFFVGASGAEPAPVEGFRGPPPPATPPSSCGRRPPCWEDDGASGRTLRRRPRWTSTLWVALR